MARIELRDGQWAELRDHINHRTDKGIKLARRRAGEDRLSAEQFEWETLLIRLYARAWSIKDDEDAAIELGDPIDLMAADPVGLAMSRREPVDRLPDDIADVLYKVAVEAWLGTTVPNAPTPPSSDGSSSD
jgi:hypothetical protein